MYYLQSRYYDPGMGRFINADTLIVEPGDALTAHNLFAYCFNDPINKTDQQGTWPSWAKKLAAAVAVVAVVAVVAAVTVATAGTGAAITCAAMGAAKGAAIGFVSGAISGAASGAVTHRIKTGRWDGAGEAALNGMADGALSGAISGAVTGAVTSPYCFVAGTAVLVASGTAAIETIQAGDLVWAWDEETGEVALKEVVETYVNETDELVHVFVNGEEIVTTPGHPFYSPVKGWTDAVHLRAGDILVLVNGEYVVVEKVQHEILEAPVTVYNFQVEDYHTYYVTDNGVLVHNSCAHNNKSWRAQKREYWRTHQNDVSDLYDLTPDNVFRMSKGRAPIGIDGYPIELHHIDGIANGDAIRAMTKTSHTILHKFIGYSKMLPYSF